MDSNDQAKARNLPHDEAWYAAARRDLTAFDAEQRRVWGDTDENLIAAYVAGICTPEETLRMEQAMKDYPAVSESVALIRRAMADQPLELGEAEPGTEPKQAPTVHPIRRYTLPIWLSAAAALLAGVTIGLIAYNRQPEPAALVASLEQRAEALQDAPPESAEVRRLRDDLLKSPIEVAALAWHSDTLLGFMARTRPKSPAQYEAELGTQVDGVMAAADHGSGKSGSSVILANLPPNLGDYAQKLYGSVWQYAGDTGRKLDPRLERFLLAGRKPGESVGMIIPAAFYVMDDASRARWDRIVALSAKNMPIKLVNTTEYHEGLVSTDDYVKAIEHAKANGVEVYAYVNCSGGGKPAADVEAEVRRWHDKFPGRFQGIYFDNQSMFNDSRVEYYARLFKFAKQIEPKWTVISATENACDEAFIKILDDNIICYKTEGAFPKFKGWESKYSRDRFAAVIHNADRLVEADFRQAAAVFGWVYATVSSEPINRYKTLPPYLEDEAALLRALNGDKSSNTAPPPASGKPRGNRSAWLHGKDITPPAHRLFRLIEASGPLKSLPS